MILTELKPGESGTVDSIKVQGSLKRRLMDMGITKSQNIYVRKVAPLGDPIEITIRGYELSIRKNEAEQINIKKL